MTREFWKSGKVSKEQNMSSQGSTSHGEEDENRSEEIVPKVSVGNGPEPIHDTEKGAISSLHRSLATVVLFRFEIGFYFVSVFSSRGQ